MAMIISLIALVAWIGLLVTWIMVLIKIFTDEENGGVGKGIFGIICWIYALIWGWQNHEKHGNKNVVLAFTACALAGIILNVLAQALA